MSAVPIREKPVSDLVKEMIKSQSMVGIISQVLLDRHPEIGRENLGKDPQTLGRDSRDSGSNR